MLLLPLGLTALLSGKEAIAIEKQMDMEEYLPMILSREIPWDYEEEMLKVQAVLARSSLFCCTEKSYYSMDSSKFNNGKYHLPVLKEELKEFVEEAKKPAYQKVSKKIERAVEATEGEIMIYQGEICQGIFHRVSSGYTRDGKEVLPESGMTYLNSVASSQDMNSEDYLHGHYFSEEDLRKRIKEVYPKADLGEGNLLEQIKITKRDSQEYVLEIQVGSLTVPGEGFRQNLELSSSNFTMQNLDGKIRFLCKGRGHGLGLSQYGGNELAKQGESYRQILFTYFPNVVLKKNGMA